VGGALRDRLADLRAASQLTDLLVGSPTVMQGLQGKRVTIGLAGACRLIVEANHLKLPTDPSGSVDWSRVTRIKIVNIEDGRDG